MDNAGCPIEGWSIITSAATNSQLAGLLAGFVFSGIIILFTRRGPRDTQALGLFCAAFVVLGFDSYLFSLVTGDTGAAPCAKAWSEGIVASGMLAVGAVAVLSGICWLLSSHTDQVRSESDALPNIEMQLMNLDRLASLMVHGVNVGVALLVARTSRDYLGIMYPGGVHAWLEWSVLAVPLAVGGTALGLVTRRRRSGRQGASRTAPRAPGVSLSVAAFGTLGYGVAAPVFVGVLTSLPGSWWIDTPSVITGITLMAGLLVPGALLVALVRSAPRLAPRGPLPGPAATGDG